MLIPLLNSASGGTASLPIWVPDSTSDASFEIEGVSLQWVPQTYDLIFILNADPPQEPRYSPDSTSDACFTVTGTTKLYQPDAARDYLFNVTGIIQGSALSAAYPLANSAVCQSYQTPNDGVNSRLTSIKIQLQKNTSWTGTLQAEVYAHTGTYGVNGLPTGSALAVSEVYTETDLTEEFSTVTLYFTGINQLLLPPSATYVFVLKLLTSNGANPAVTVAYDLTSPVKTGNSGKYTNQ